MNALKCIPLLWLCATQIAQAQVAERVTTDGYFWPTGTSAGTDRTPNGTNCEGAYLSRGPACYNNETYHIGYDILMPEGSPVYPIADGKVVAVSRRGWGAGNVALWIEHKYPGQETKFSYMYGHVKDLNLQTNQPFKAGVDEVEGGKVMATVGYLSNPHLHVGVVPGTTLPKSPPAYPEYGYGIMQNTLWREGDLPNRNNTEDPIQWLYRYSANNYFKAQGLSATAPKVTTTADSSSLSGQQGEVVAVSTTTKSISSFNGNVLTIPGSIQSLQSNTSLQFLAAPWVSLSPGEQKQTKGFVWIRSAQAAGNVPLEVRSVFSSPVSTGVSPTSSLNLTVTPKVSVSQTLTAPVLGDLATTGGLTAGKPFTVYATGSNIDPVNVIGYFYSSSCPSGCAGTKIEAVNKSAVISFTPPSAGNYQFKLRNGPGGSESFGKDITVYQPMQATCSSSRSSGPVNTPVTYTTTATGGLALYSYSWEEGVDASTASVTVSYPSGGVLAAATVTVSDQLGNQATATCGTGVELSIPTITSSGFFGTLQSGFLFSGYLRGTNFSQVNAEVWFCKNGSATDCIGHTGTVVGSYGTSESNLELSNILLTGGSWQAKVRNGPGGTFSSLSTTFAVGGGTTAGPGSFTSAFTSSSSLWNNFDIRTGESQAAWVTSASGLTVNPTGAGTAITERTYVSMDTTWKIRFYLRSGGIFALYGLGRSGEDYFHAIFNPNYITSVGGKERGAYPLISSVQNHWNDLEIRWSKTNATATVLLNGTNYGSFPSNTGDARAMLAIGGAPTDVSSWERTVGALTTPAPIVPAAGVTPMLANGTHWTVFDKRTTAGESGDSYTPSADGLVIVPGIGPNGTAMTEKAYRSGNTSWKTRFYLESGGVVAIYGMGRGGEDIFHAIFDPTYKTSVAGSGARYELPGGISSYQNRWNDLEISRVGSQVTISLNGTSFGPYQSITLDAHVMIAVGKKTTTLSQWDVSSLTKAPAPTLNTVDGSQRRPNTSTSFTFIGTGFDILTMSVEFDAAGPCAGYACKVPNSVLTQKFVDHGAGPANLAPGTYNVRVRNGDGQVSLESKQVTVTAPVPLALSCSPASTTVMQGTSVSFSCSPSGGTLPYPSLTWSGGPLTGQSGISVSGTFNTPGTNTVSATLRDNLNNQVSWSGTVTVTIAVPLSVTCSVSPSPMYLGDGATVYAYAGGGTQVGYTYQMGSGGSFSSVNQVFVAPSSFSTFTYQVWAKDSSGAQATYICAAPVTGKAPVISGVIVNSPRNNTPFDVSISGSYLYQGSNLWFCKNGTTNCFQHGQGGVGFFGSTFSSMLGSSVQLTTGQWQVEVRSSYGTGRQTGYFTINP